jgi:hypothetical protein
MLTLTRVDEEGTPGTETQYLPSPFSRGCKTKIHYCEVIFVILKIWMKLLMSRPRGTQEGNLGM